VDEFAKIPGVGFTEAVQLAAAFDLENRLTRETLAHQKIDSPELVNTLVGGEMRILRKEAMRVVLLDTRYQMIRVEGVSGGPVNESIALPWGTVSAGRNSGDLCCPCGAQSSFG
jgi:DNA repair protein RadC